MEDRLIGSLTPYVPGLIYASWLVGCLPSRVSDCFSLRCIGILTKTETENGSMLECPRELGSMAKWLVRIGRLYPQNTPFISE